MQAHFTLPDEVFVKFLWNILRFLIDDNCQSLDTSVTSNVRLKSILTSHKCRKDCEMCYARKLLQICMDSWKSLTERKLSSCNRLWIHAQGRMKKCCNHFSLCQHKEHLLIKKTFYVTIILTDSFHSNMLLFIVLAKPICPYEKHSKYSCSLHTELSVHQCAIPCAIEQSFPTFLSWRDTCLCKRFTYVGGKKNVAHGLYSVIASFWTNIPWQLEGDTWNFLWCFKIFICVCMPWFFAKLLWCFAECWLGNTAVDGALYVLLPLIRYAGNSIECQVNIMMYV